MKKIALYTVAYGRNLRFNIPKLSDMDVDKFCFSDMDRKNGFYQTILCKVNQPSPVRKQRFVKIIIPDEIFNNYEYSLYLDCKRPYEIDFDYLFSCLEDDSDILTRIHNKRNCLYDEGKFCVLKKRDSKEAIFRQLRYYKSQGCPWSLGLYASGLLLRRHTQKVKEFCQEWWTQIEAFSHRDQISLPFIAWKTGMKISTCGRGK